MRLPSANGFRITKKNPSLIDLHSFMYTSVIGASTALRMPALMSKFPNFFGAGGAPSWEIDVWQKFQDSIKAQAKKVQAEDAKRSVEFK